MKEFKYPCYVVVVTDINNKNPRFIVTNDEDDMAMFITKSDVISLGNVRKMRCNKNNEGTKIEISELDIDYMKGLACSIISKRYKQLGINVKNAIFKKNNKNNKNKISKKSKIKIQKNKKPENANKVCGCYIQLGTNAHLLFCNCPVHGDNKINK